MWSRGGTTTNTDFLLIEMIAMGISRATTERQLQLAKDDLAAATKKLQAAQVAEASYGLHPSWRSAAAKVKQIGARLRKIASIEAQNEEVARLKAEKLAAAAQEKGAPRKKKEKPAKAAEPKAAKKKAKGE